MNFYQAAIDGSSKYYEYLIRNNKGIIETKVNHIDVDKNGCILTLTGKLHMPDQVQVKIGANIYTQEQMKPISYDEDNRIIVVRPLIEFRHILLNADAKDVALISDLRFLVKRVEDWYIANGKRLQMPELPPNIKYNPQNQLKQQPSDEQTNAILGALSSPFSYIWGAPGTGKTQFVLARCIITYLLSNRRVLITAPTNNAVEQMLNGVLAVLEDAGMPLDKILRLGIPSKSFNEKYPSVCEDVAIEKLLSQIDESIQSIDDQMELLSKYKNYLNFVNGIDRCKALAPEIFEYLKYCKLELTELSNLFEVNVGKITVFQEEILKTQQSFPAIASEIININSLIEKYNKGIRKRLFKSKKTAYITQLSEKVALSDSLSDKIIELQSFIGKLKIEQESIETKKRNTTEKAAAEISKLFEMMNFWPDFLNEMKQITVETSERFFEKFESQIKKGQEIIKQKSEKYSCLDGVTEEALLNKKEELQQERKRIEGGGTNARLKDCLIVAATIDTCLYRITPEGDFLPEHVFLDEAGYCSLIKVGTLFAYDCPITFFGDHMQLPPVCEMDDEVINSKVNLFVGLWAQSALYAEEIFTSDPIDICLDYLKYKPAPFQNLVKFDLTHSFRFGESIAKVLSLCVYQNGFHGVSNHNTDIFYINAKKEPGKKARTSLSECRAIKIYVDSHPDENIGIITPYKNQRAEIKTMLGKTSKMDDDIVTVHGSQGREWDTVLLSVVDTYDKYFTDSQKVKSNGKNVINTAVSRARRNLIIVCDADVWMPDKKQLIGQLLKVAQEITI